MAQPNRNQKTRVVVLFGGESAEHDVSCVTAAHVLRALDAEKYSVTTIGITRHGEWIHAELPPSPDVESLQVKGVATNSDVVLKKLGDETQLVVFPLLHGPMGEDGTVQGMLELAHVAYVGSGVLGSAVAMDKGVAKQIMAANGVDQQKFLVARASDDHLQLVDRALEEFGLPLFVKPANMGSSIGVQKAKSREEVLAALQLALEYDEWALIEEAIVGREIEVAVLGNESPRASLPGEIVPSHEFYDYEDKYLVDGAKLLVPAPLSAKETEQVQQLALRIYKVLRAEGMARVDFFYEEKRRNGDAGRGFLCNEINTIPGFTPISMYPKLWQASGLSYPQLLDELISLALARQTKRRNKTTR
ncbi:MAG: D-alanine--D-alanine ligase [Actinobacteria bacterium]|nr:D-alanine--D-alanine ligase [Actinomycetota bacterium]